MNRQMRAVGVAQPVEHWIVAPEVAGSKPAVHPSWHCYWRLCLALVWHCSLQPRLYSCQVCLRFANVAELVDAPGLGPGIERCESSSLSVRTRCFVFDVNQIK